MIENNKKTNQLLEDIKKLLILFLIRQGTQVQSKDIANTLGVDPAIISRMVPVRQAKKKDNQ